MLDYWRLIRPRIVALVLLAMAVSAWTTAAGSSTALSLTLSQWERGQAALPSPFGRGAEEKNLPSPFGRGAGGEGGLGLVLTHALLGAALIIAGAIALNQRIEWRGDALMSRTADRPLPTGRLSRRQVTVFGLATTAIGLVYLAMLTNLTLTLLAGAGWLMYVAIYTPLKSRSPWQTPVGAAAGALPVLLGAAAVGQPLSLWAITLFGIVYFWQFPHSMAIAWLYRYEFAAGGVRVATVTDPTGRTAGISAVIGAAILLPVSLVPLWIGSVSAAYGAAAAVLGIVYLTISIWFALRRGDHAARQLLRASLLYLPMLFAAMLML